MPLDRHRTDPPPDPYDEVEDIVNPWPPTAPDELRDSIDQIAADAKERDRRIDDAENLYGLKDWAPRADDDSGSFFGTDRTVEPESLKRDQYRLTRWLRARWWMARKVEWLACLVGGDRWCP